MKALRIGLALVGLMGLSNVALAQVILNIGDNTIVTAINGQEVKNGLFTEPQRRFTLAPGKHVVTAKYTRLYELRGDNHDVLRSGNISLPIDLVDNQTYTLVMANQPDAYAQAKEYAQKPTLALLQNGQTVMSQQATGGANGGIFSGLSGALGNVFGGSKAAESNQQTINALQTGSTAAIPAIQPSTPAASNASTLDQFMQLWLKATPTERDKIRQWVSQ